MRFSLRRPNSGGPVSLVTCAAARLTSKLSLALPRLVLCFCQKVSGLMSSAL